jgi:hypothetical protein
VKKKDEMNLNLNGMKSKKERKSNCKNEKRVSCISSKLLNITTTEYKEKERRNENGTQGRYSCTRHLLCRALPK